MLNIERPTTISEIDEKINTSRKKYQDTLNFVHVQRDNLMWLANHALTLAQYLSYEQSPEHNAEAKQAIAHCAQAYALLFSLANDPERVVELEFNGEQHDTQYNGVGLVEQGRINAQNWQEAVFCALTARDHDALSSLLAFDLSHLRESRAVCPEVELMLAELLQKVLLGEEVSQPEIIALSQQIAADTNPLVQHCTNAKLSLINNALISKATDLDETFLGALNHYWQYQGQHLYADHAHTNFYMPIELLGTACLVQDQGRSVDIDTDFMPRFYIVS